MSHNEDLLTYLLTYLLNVKARSHRRDSVIIIIII